MTTQTGESYKSINEVAEMLRVDWQTVRKLILTGKLKALKVGRQWRISERELNRYIESRSTHLIHL